MRLHHATVVALLIAPALSGVEGPVLVTAQGTSNLYHVISSVRITFPKRGGALHQSYWQTVRRDKDGTMIAAAMGRSEDRLVKRNGRWLIQSRKLSVFTD